jgi:hypothetical protein
MKMLVHWIWPLLLAGALPANAADEAGPAAPQHRLLNDRFRLSLGGFYSDSTTQARLSTPTGGAGVDVNFEDVLGLDERKLVGEGALYWRFGERWRLDLNYFSLNRSASRTLATQIDWGGNTYPVGTVVDSNYKVTDLRAAIGYSLFRRIDKEIGLGLGLHSTSFKASLDAAGAGAKSENVTAPLPIAVLYANFALTDKWAFSARSDWLSLSYDKYSGSIRSSAVDFVYQPFEHWAFGFGVHSLTIRLDVNDPDARFATRVVFQGPSAFASYSF